MARKKSRTARAPGVRETGIIASPILPNSPRVALSGESEAAVKPQERFWLDAIVSRISRWVGSLQLAVFLLALFAVVLVIGTIIESWYDGNIAQQLVYRTWWFLGLLVALGANIFFAAVKKCDFSGWSALPNRKSVGILASLSRLWPWKKHQTGFLITHVGLLTMVTGGILNSIGGTDAVMATVDSDSPEAGRFGSHTSHSILDRGVSLLRIKMPHQKDQEKSFVFEHGPTCWKADEYVQPKLDSLAGVLNFLAHPFPRSWETTLDNGARLEVLNYYPTVRQVSFGPAHSADKPFPAIKFQLSTPRLRFMRDQQQWVAFNREDDRASLGPALVEFMARDTSAGLLKEFQNPPAPEKVGKKGQLAVFWGGGRFLLDVADQIEHPLRLGASGWSLRIQNYFPNYKDKDDKPSNPVLLLELLGPQDQKVRLAVEAHKPAELLGSIPPELEGLQVWFHPPDYRYAEDSVRALLQFATGPDGRIYFRTFNSAGGRFALEKTGTVEKGEKRLPIWKGMDWQLRVLEFIPQAGPGPVPEDRRLGLEDEMETPPAIRCRLTYKDDSKDFWVMKTDQDLTSVTVGGEPFKIGFNSNIRPLDFEITLLRAEQTSDPGTGMAATYSSFVELTDPRRNLFGSPRVITMNQPLEWDGYKLYQSGYKFLGMDPETNRPVNQSVLTVGRDPGMPFKYVGSSMLALGITCMFYMKAYFFKPRGRSKVATIPPTNGEAAREDN